MIYYADMNDEWESNYFIGVFSTADKAREACQQWSNTRKKNPRRLIWIGLGDALSAQAGMDKYEINPLELDLMILPHEYPDGTK